MRDQCNSIPRWLVLAVLVATIGRFTCDGLASVSRQHTALRIPWKSFAETMASKSIPTKPILLLTTHADGCPSCERAEMRLQEETNAKNIVERFQPVKLVDPRDISGELGGDFAGKKFLERLGTSNVPCLSIVMPDGWNVDHGDVITEHSLYFSYPFDLKQFLTQDPRKSLPVEFEENGGGYIQWRHGKERVLPDASAKKPLFVYFNQLKDLHCMKSKPLLLNNSDVSRIANTKCIPILVSSVSRMNQSDSAFDSELIKRCRVTAFPAVAILYKDRAPLVYRGTDGKALADFLGAATGETSVAPESKKSAPLN